MRFHEVLADDALRTLVAEDERVQVGHSTFGASRDSDVGADVGEIRTFFVSPASWRRGVGSALMRRALEEIALMGFVETTLWSFADNERANAFYERHGFRRDGAEQREDVWAGLLEVRYRR